MKKVLVTGASGFLGNYVILELLAKGYTVIATSTSANKCASREWFSKVNYIPFCFHDFSAQVNYFEFFQKPDFVIHLAWEGLPNYKSLFHFEENLPRHYTFLKNLISNGLRDLTVTGTCFEYGFREGRLSEDMIANPANPYALAKDTLRRFLQQLQALQPFSLKWLRLFYMYGKGQSPKSIFSQLDNAIQNDDANFNMSGGEQVRDYLPVEVVAQNIVTAAIQNNSTGIINCCSGKPVVLKELVKEYLINRDSSISLNLGFYPYLDYEPMQFWGDPTKMQTIIQNEKSF